MKLILEMGHLPVGMEFFTAGDDEQWKVITRTIDQCDYYVIVLAHRYGSLSDDGRSYTEKEYDYAVSKGIPVQAHLLDESVAWSPAHIDSSPGKEALNQFKAKLQTRMCKWWKNADDLRSKVSVALQKAFVDNPRPGYVRGLPGFSGELMQELSVTRAEIARLRRQASLSSVMRLRELVAQGRAFPRVVGPYKQTQVDWHLSMGWYASVLNNLIELGGENCEYVKAIRRLNDVDPGSGVSKIDGICATIDNVVLDFESRAK